jgi:hypothetical protein
MRKRNWDKWIALVSVISSIISGLKGWITMEIMQSIINFWNNLNPWKFLAVVFFLIFLVSSMDYIRNRLNDIEKRLNSLEDKPAIEARNQWLKERERTEKKVNNFLIRLFTGGRIDPER